MARMTTARKLLLGLLGGGAAFNPNLPLTISGLVLWLDASDSTTLFQDDAGTTPAVANDAVVGRWADKSGLGRNMIQATANQKPLLKTAIQNGKNVLFFDGTNDSMAATFGATVMTAQTTITVIAVNWGLADAYSRAITQGNGAAEDNAIANGFIPLVRDAAQTKYTLYANGTYATSITLADTTTAVWCSRTDGSNAIPRLNGVDGTTLAKPFNQSVSEFVLGRRSGNTDAIYGGYMLEVLTYNRALTASELTSVESYLNAKWVVF
jgi:hypothetical protein